MTVMRVMELGDQVLVYDSEELRLFEDGSLAVGHLSVGRDVLPFHDPDKPNVRRVMTGVTHLRLELRFEPWDAGALWVDKDATDEEITQGLEKHRQGKVAKFEELSTRLAGTPLTTHRPNER